MVVDVERSSLVSTHRGTLADVIDGWLEAIATDRSTYTLREHVRAMGFWGASGWERQVERVRFVIG